MARAGGFRLGRLVAVNEGGYIPFYREAATLDSGFGGGAPVAAPAPNIEPGSEELTSQVTLTYEIL
jgi:hypothetical protein